MSEAETDAAAERRTETIPEWKREEVDELVAFVESYESVGIVDITGIPSRQLQDMRRGIHGTAELRVSRNTLIRRSLDEVDEGLEDLNEHVTGQVGLIGTNDNPFGLYQQLEASKTAAPIAAGEVAPNDIVIPAGDTGIDPGPFVGELQQIGASASIEDGSIVVHDDSMVLEAGGEVDATLENVLGELGIEPKEVGLDLRAVHSEGVLFEPEELDIDVEAYRADLETAAARARNLSINATYPTDRTVGALLSKAAGDAKSLGLSAEIASPGIAGDLVSKADAQVRALAAQIDDEEALPEELRGTEAAPAPEPETEESDSTEESTDDQADETEAEGDDADDDDDEDGDAAEGLGEMFG